MSIFARAVEVLREACREPSMSPVHACDIMATALEAAGLLAPDAHIIRTPEELEALACEDPAAIVLASKAGMVRTAGALWGVYRLGSMWGLPAVIIATGDQVRDAREAMEIDNG